MLAAANTGSCVDPQNKIGHPARRYTQLIGLSALGFARYTNRLHIRCYCVSGLEFRNREYNFDFTKELGVFCEI